VPRWQKTYLKDYSFTGMDHKADLNLPKEIPPILDWANEYFKEYTKYKFNQVLLNWYKNGLDYIGPHSDDEKQLKPNSLIFSCTFADPGVIRTFRIRSKDSYPGSIFEDIKLTDGVFIVMGGNMQKEFRHEIVKINGKRGENTGRRINITFRQFYN
jgi:alkylated DNA repair dioxygenase AlkB